MSENAELERFFRESRQRSFLAGFITALLFEGALFAFLEGYGSVSLGKTAEAVVCAGIAIALTYGGIRLYRDSASG